MADRDRKILRALRAQVRSLRDDLLRVVLERDYAEELLLETVERFGKDQPPSRKAVRAAARIADRKLESSSEEDDGEGAGNR